MSKNDIQGGRNNMFIQMLLIKSYQVVMLTGFVVCIRTIINALLWTSLFDNTNFEKAFKLLKKYLVGFTFVTAVIIVTT